MRSEKNKGVIDLRRGRANRPPARQQPLFSLPKGPLLPETPRRPLPLRARRRRIRYVLVFGLLVLLGALFYATVWLSYRPELNIASIEVSGAEGISEERIKERVEAILDDGSFHLLSHRNIFLYPREQLEEELVNSFAPIRAVHITRASLFSTALLVSVEEREPFAQWCTDLPECYFMDPGGFIYASVGEHTDHMAQATSSTPYVFTGGISSIDPIRQSFIQAHLPGLISLLTFLGQAGLTSLGARIENDQDFSIPLREGFLLKVSFGADPAALVRNLQLVLSSEALKGKREKLEYVDLRFGNRVYYKLKGEAEASGAQ